MSQWGKYGPGDDDRRRDGGYSRGGNNSGGYRGGRSRGRGRNWEDRGSWRGGGRGQSWGNRQSERGGRSYSDRPRRGEESERPDLELCKTSILGSCTRGGCRYAHAVRRHAELAIHDSVVKGIALLERGENIQLITSSNDGKWKITNTLSWAEDGVFQMGGEVEVILVANNFLFCGFEAPVELVPGIPVGQVRAWNMDNPGTPLDFKVSEAMPFAHARQVQSINIGGDIIATGGNEGMIRLWRFDTATNAFKVFSNLEAHARGVTGILFCGEFVWSASIDRTIKVWQVAETGDSHCVHSISSTANGHSDAITGFQLWNFENQNYILSGGLDGKVTVWEENGNHCYTEELRQPVFAITVATDTEGSPLIAIATADCAIQIRELPSFKFKCSLNSQFSIGHRQPVRSLTSGPRFTLYSGSADGVVMVWQIIDKIAGVEGSGRF